MASSVDLSFFWHFEQTIFFLFFFFSLVMVVVFSRPWLLIDVKVIGCEGNGGNLAWDGCMTPPLYTAPYYFGLCGLPDLYTYKVVYVEIGLINGRFTPFALLDLLIAWVYGISILQLLKISIQSIFPTVFSLER